ncbi:Uncharacterised protein [Vibrio cholerae]|nr:Uncharacterised protein [Vibrio cholerae]
MPRFDHRGFYCGKFVHLAFNLWRLNDGSCFDTGFICGVGFGEGD